MKTLERFQMLLITFVFIAFLFANCKEAGNHFSKRAHLNSMKQYGDVDKSSSYDIMLLTEGVAYGYNPEGKDTAQVIMLDREDDRMDLILDSLRLNGIRFRSLLYEDKIVFIYDDAKLYFPRMDNETKFKTL